MDKPQKFFSTLEPDAKNLDSAHPHPSLENWPEFWWMNETDRANAFEARARAYGGQGYRSYPDHEQDRGR